MNVVELGAPIIFSGPPCGCIGNPPLRKRGARALALSLFEGRASDWPIRPSDAVDNDEDIGICRHHQARRHQSWIDPAPLAGLLLRQVAGIRVDQGLSRAIVVGGTGGTADPFPEIASPLEFRRRVQLQSST
jgi:hypothetical protein